MVQRRVLDSAKEQFVFHVMPAARMFLLREGTDPKYGARHLRRAIERHVVSPLANLLATAQIALGDVVSIDWDGARAELTFRREAQGAVVPARVPQAEFAARANAAVGGHGLAVHAARMV